MNERATSTPSTEEHAIWKGSPSQVVNLGVYVLCVLAAALIVVVSLLTQTYLLNLLLALPVLYALWKYLDKRKETYEVTTQRIRFREGVFSRRTDELELYRVKDSVLMEPFSLRLFGLGTIHLITSDTTAPDAYLRAVRDPAALRDRIRRCVEIRRDQKGVREIDFE